MHVTLSVFNCISCTSSTNQVRSVVMGLVQLPRVRCSWKLWAWDYELQFMSGNFGCWTKRAGTPYKTNKAVICYLSLSVLLNISHWLFSTSGRRVMVCVLHTSWLSGDNTVVLHTFCVHVAPGIFAVKVLNWRSRKERVKDNMDVGSNVKHVGVCPLLLYRLVN